MAKTVKSLQVAVGKEGQQLRIDAKFADGTSEQIDFDASLASGLVQSLIQGAATAERMRKAEPGSPVSTSVPWRARDVRVGAVVGSDDMVAVGFTTEQGPPVEIVLPRTTAEKTIRAILDELRKKVPPQ